VADAAQSARVSTLQFCHAADHRQADADNFFVNNANTHHANSPDLTRPGVPLPSNRISASARAGHENSIFASAAPCGSLPVFQTTGFTMSCLERASQTATPNSTAQAGNHTGHFAGAINKGLSFVRNLNQLETHE
jgi:hypothetical protein